MAKTVWQREDRVRTVRFLVAVMMLGAVGYGALWAGMRGAGMAERLVAMRVGEALSAARLDWAEPEVDGLSVVLRGRAPDGFAREMALSVVASATPPAQLIDRIAVARTPVEAPPFAVSLLGGADSLTLSGHVDTPETRARLLGRLRQAAPRRALDSLIGIGAAAPQTDPGPAFAVAGLAAALLAGLRQAAPRRALDSLIGIGAAAPQTDPGPAFAVAGLAAALLAEARIEIAPPAVSVAGVVRDRAQMRMTSAQLRTAAGDRVALALDLSAPPEVIAPFLLRVVKSPGGGLALDRCAARSAAEAEALIALLTRHGVEAPTCRHGSGGPAGDWPAAAAAGLAALERVAEGRLALEYREARLTLPDDLPDETRTALATALDAALPPGYRGRIAGEARGGASVGTPAPAPWLHATRGPEGVVLAGRLPDAAGERALETVAAALFGRAAVRAALGRAGGTASGGWQRAALLTVEALAELDGGEATLTEGRLTLAGRISEPAAIGRLQRRLEAALPDHAVETRLTVDVPALVAALPLDPARCAAALNELMTRQGVGFAPGSAVIDAEGPRVLARAAAILGRCPEARLEIGGHTDSQGSEGFNLRLSQARAEAVRRALAARGIAPRRLEAHGYGEADPIAPNATEAGRARNRRIAFRPLETPS